MTIPYRLANLQNQFVERLFLLGTADFFIIVCYLSVCSCLFSVVSFECFIKQFVIDFFNTLIAIIYIEVGTVSINILRFEFTAVVIDRAFPDHCTYRSLHKFISYPFCADRRKPLLLSAKVTQKHFCQLRQQKCNLQAGFALSEGRGRLFEKSPLHPAKTLSVTVYDDSDGIFDTAPTPKNIVTPSPIVTPVPSGIVLLFARSDYGCSHKKSYTHLVAVPH